MRVMVSFTSGSTFYVRPQYLEVCCFYLLYSLFRYFSLKGFLHTRNLFIIPASTTTGVSAYIYLLASCVTLCLLPLPPSTHPPFGVGGIGECVERSKGRGTASFDFAAIAHGQLYPNSLTTFAP